MILFFVLLVIQFFVVRKSTESLFLFLRTFLPHPLPFIVVAILFFPGTVIHELAHFITGIALFLRVRGLHLLPEWSHDHLVLGHVTYEKADFFRGFLVGIAPLPAALVALWVSYQWFIVNGDATWQTVLFFYLVFAISSTMFSSKSDLTDGAAFLLFTGILIGVLYFFSVDVLGSIRAFLFSESVQSTLNPFFTVLNYFIGIALGIHLLIILLFHVFFHRFLHHR